MTLRVGPAATTDERAVTHLWRACGLTVPYNDPATDFRFALGRESSDVLIARAECGRIVGTVMVGHDGHRGWVYYLAAEPMMQRQGIGSVMVEAAENWLKERGVVKLQLLVRETNAGVVAFYEKLGFEVTPRVIMAKWLDGRE